MKIRDEIKIKSVTKGKKEITIGVLAFILGSAITFITFWRLFSAGTNGYISGSSITTIVVSVIVIKAIDV